MDTIHQPVIHPRPISRPSTPISSSQDDFETPTATRHRSGTMMTASSSSSFPYVQTPETPSILGVIHRQFESPDVVPTHLRKDSYGFGEMLSLAFSGPTAYREDVTDREQGTPIVGIISSPAVDGSDDEVERSLPAIPTSSELETTIDDTISSSPLSTTTRPSMLSIFSLDDPPLFSPSAESGLRFPSPQPDVPSDGPSASAQPEHKRAKSSLKSMVRKKLERSKSSFKAIRGRRDDKTDNEPYGEIRGSSLSSLGPPELQHSRPKTSRLRSLLLISMSRSQSSASIRSTTSTSSHTTSSSALQQLANPLDTGSPAVSVPRVPSDVSIIVRDFATIPGSEEVGTAETMGGEPFRSSNRAPQISVGGLVEPLTLPSRSKGKARARSPFARSTRPNLFSSTSSGTLYDEPSTSVLSASPRISRPRAISMSLVADRLSQVVISSPGSEKKVDLFGTLLPRELQVMILSKLVEMSAEKTGNEKWEGETGGRRHLFRLSRVSKSWQAICLDGQLWPLVHLARFAPHLAPPTLRRLLISAQPFITSLSLHGMDNLVGSDMIAAISSPDTLFHNLTALDLRGCKRLTSDDVVALLSSASNLQTVNFKGLQAVSSEVVRTLARSVKSLQSLDVSRCWNISLCDLVVFLKMISVPQASGLKVLRLAGIKGYGTTSGEFLPLVAERLINLETLDLLGCTHLFDTDFQQFAEVLDNEGRVSPLSHLIISGCASLGFETFYHLAKRMPNLINLEAAGMPDAYGDRDADDQSLVKLLRSVTRLEKLDLEGTGLYGGVTDRVIDILTPAKGVQGIVGRNLVELRIGFAREVTSEALIRLVRGCTKLRVLEADNTSANNAVMREFLRRRPATAHLSLIDCRAITPTAYSSLASSTRPRSGWTGYPAVPFGYDGEREGKAVLKTFWSWRRVGVPKAWRESLADIGRDDEPETVGVDAGLGESKRPQGMKRRGSRWAGENGEEDRAGCIVM